MPLRTLLALLQIARAGLKVLLAALLGLVVDLGCGFQVGQVGLAVTATDGRQVKTNVVRRFRRQRAQDVLAELIAGRAGKPISTPDGTQCVQPCGFSATDFDQPLSQLGITAKFVFQLAASCRRQSFVQKSGKFGIGERVHGQDSFAHATFVTHITFTKRSDTMACCITMKNVTGTA